MRATKLMIQTVINDMIKNIFAPYFETPEGYNYGEHIKEADLRSMELIIHKLRFLIKERDKAPDQLLYSEETEK